MIFKRNEFLARLSSRKFLLTIAGLVFYILGGVLGKFPWETAIDAVWKIIVLYVGIEGGADFISRLKEE